ncbi:MAG: MFS transporter [Candidatus Nealsonbacteria bacterium]
MTLGINKVIRTLISTDILLQGGWGLIGPIFAIFLTKQLQGGSLEMVGFVAATYWITKSVVQPFIAHALDVKGGERDDFKLLILGMFLANLVPLGYFFSTQIWHIFLLEFFRGLAMACVIPTWLGIFTRHVDKGWEAFSWSLESTGIGFAAGFAGAFGGILAAAVGFKTVFILASIFGLTASSLLFLIRPGLFDKDHFKPGVPPTEKPF